MIKKLYLNTNDLKLLIVYEKYIYNEISCTNKKSLQKSFGLHFLCIKYRIFIIFLSV